MKGRIIFFALVAALVAGAIIYTRTRPAPQIILTGIVTTDDVIVSSQISGRVQKLLVNQGDAVKAGQLLAVIEPDQYQADMAYYQSTHQQAATQVAEDQAQLRFQQRQTHDQIDQAKANLTVAQSQLEVAQADLKNAQLQADQEQEAYRRGAESVRARDEAVAQLEGQQARVNAARNQINAATAALAMAQSNEEQISARQAAVDMSTHQVAAAGAQLDKARVQLGYTEVRAPIGGIVDARAALQGEIVNPAQAIVTLVDPDDLWVRADVEETYIDSIHLGDKLEVRFPSGSPHTGTVFYRAVDADYATQRDVSRTKRDIKTFEIRLRCDNSDRAMALGMTAFVVLPPVSVAH
jgi:HlyD family secretion protein